MGNGRVNLHTKWIDFPHGHHSERGLQSPFHSKVKTNRIPLPIPTPHMAVFDIPHLVAERIFMSVEEPSSLVLTCRLFWSVGCDKTVQARWCLLKFGKFSVLPSLANTPAYRNLLTPALLGRLAVMGAHISRYTLQRLARSVAWSAEPSMPDSASFDEKMERRQRWASWKEEIEQWAIDECERRFGAEVELFHDSTLVNDPHYLEDVPPRPAYDPKSLDDMELFLHLTGAVRSENVFGMEALEWRMREVNAKLVELGSRGFAVDFARWLGPNRNWRLAYSVEDVVDRVVLTPPSLLESWCRNGMSFKPVAPDFWPKLFAHPMFPRIASSLPAMARSVCPADGFPQMLFDYLGSLEPLERAGRLRMAATAFPGAKIEAAARTNLDRMVKVQRPSAKGKEKDNVKEKEKEKDDKLQLDGDFIWSVGVAWPETISLYAVDVVKAYLDQKPDDWKDQLLALLTNVIAKTTPSNCVVRPTSSGRSRAPSTPASTFRALLADAISRKDQPTRNWLLHISSLVPDWESTALSSFARPLSHCPNTLVRTFAIDPSGSPTPGGHLSWMRHCSLTPSGALAQVAFECALRESAECRAPDRLAMKWKAVMAGEEPETDQFRQRGDLAEEVLAVAERYGWWVSPYHVQILWRVVEEQGAIAELDGQVLAAPEIFVFYNYGGRGLDALVEKVLRMAERTWLRLPKEDCRHYVDEVLRGRGLKTAKGASLGEKVQEMWYRQFASLLREVRKCARKAGVEGSPVVLFRESLLNFMQRIVRTVI
ncbi:hypothetical protein M427DRAFT_67092 [Gonapodya prolifera JEL478]|uniref:Uncharacterized protein n=1 Tax=Gonapodya prolifera (strain JEL478) TaxID=1344416 RepID=A0A139ARU4_GONPJ|nr:hypothetical protein M427DRAFT_67092 [Gonapodya prolifera JEL478]|eukprot:KXS19439.1 hypothetical protein M427DRAFT_67092 [Gonapodya prolifera JEL478]